MQDSPIRASAPCKLILSGEHFAVWGSGSICVPIEMRNYASVRLSGAKGFILRRDWGETDLSMPVAQVDGRAHFLKGTYDALCRIAGKPVAGMEADVPITSNPKGIGNSSSVAAALAAASLKALGLPLTQENLFQCAHAADLVAHGGAASGVDARTVTVGKPILFKKLFGPERFTFRKIRLNMPAGASLVLIDTFTGKKCTTKEQIARFAESFGMEKKPSQCTAAQRKSVTGKFEPVLKALLSEFSRPAPSAQKIGSLFLENHGLLSAHGVSTRQMDSFIGECVESGHAWGAKMTGAGGEGGSLIVLAKHGECGAIESLAKSHGFGSIAVSVSRAGIKVE